MKKKFESVKWFQRMMIVLLVLVLIAFIAIVPLIANQCAVEYSELAYLRVPLMIYCWVCSVPILYALWITIGVCRDLVREDSFTRYTSKALIRISVLAQIEALFILGWGIIFFCVGKEHLVLTLAVVAMILAALAASIFCRVLSKIIDNALDIKEESEFTI